MTHVRLALALGLASLLAASPAATQGPASPDLASCRESAAEGVRRAESQDWAGALAALGQAVSADSLCVTPGGALAGDWLGRVQLQAGDVEGALVTWERALSAADGKPVPGREELVGRYLDAMLATGQAGTPAAARAFERLLLPTRTPPVGDSPYWRSLSQVASVVPDSVSARAFAGGDWRRGVASGGDRALGGWWLSQDPFPATRANERVAEHLLRVAEALASYPEPGRPEGYDDRGRLFVRFGAPTVARQLTFNATDLLTGMGRASVGVSRSSFPDNEVWTYGAIDETMIYVLIGQNGVYRLGQTEDLLPSTLRNVTGRGRRELARARVALLAMRYIYRELATTSIEYGNAWGETDSILEGTASPFGNPGSAALTIQRDLSVREAERGRERARREPPSTSGVVAQTPPVVYGADVARFLGPDGGTRLDLVWQLRDGPYPPLVSGGVLAGSVVERPGTFEQSVAAPVSQALTPAQVEGADYVPPVLAAVACGSGPCVPAVQLGLFAVDAEGRPVERIGTSVWRLPPQVPLRSSGFEMSDLRPMDAARNEPFVGESVPVGLPLSLYFEAYGFEGGADRSRVYIEYEVVRRQLGNLLRRTREVPSTGDLRLLIDGDRTQQYVILDTSDWAGADEVEVRVLTRDERTGEVVERSRTFRVGPG